MIRRRTGRGGVTVAAQIGEDDAVAVAGDGGGRTVVQPLQPGSREAMDQHQRPALPRDAVGKFHAVTAGEPVHGRVGHVSPYLTWSSQAR
jgi:hypothetical protein